jgi:hypothetical protein
MPDRNRFLEIPEQRKPAKVGLQKSKFEQETVKPGAARQIHSQANKP